MTTFRGFPACTCLAKWLPAYEAELHRRGVLKGPLHIYQLIGGAAASGGTHISGGAADLLDLPGNVDWAIARQMGADASWSRLKNWDNAGGMPHFHLVLRGCPHASAAAKRQYTSTFSGVDHGHNGLANGAKDNGPALSHRTWEQGIEWAKAQQFALRIGTWNLPADDKLPDPAGRIKRAAQIVNAAKLGIIGWNELQPIKRAGVASTFAWNLDAALGKRYKMVKPTRPFNENYLSYDSELVTLVKQYDDSILEAPTGGRHITRTAFKDNESGLVFAVGQTHLVDGDTAAHARDRKAQAADAVTSMRAVSAKHDDCSIIIQGDFNTPDRLPAFEKWKRTREYADASSTRNSATYTNYAKSKPSTNPDWAIDQIEVTPAFYVVGYSVLLDTHTNGLFEQPRPSDHQLTITSLTHS